MDIQFQLGQFQKFRILSGLHLGQYSIDLPAGAEVEFDGQVLNYGGQSWPAPAVLGAIRVGWLVPVADVNTKVCAPKSAGVSVHTAAPTGQDRGPAQMLVAVAEDEQIVGTLEASNAKRKADLISTPAPFRAKPVEVITVPSHVPEANRATAPRPAPTTVPVNSSTLRAQDEATQKNIKKYAVIDAATEDDGIPVAKIKSSTHSFNKLEGGARDIDSAIHQLENQKPQIQRLPQLKKATVNSEAEAGESISRRLPGGATGDVATPRSGDTLEELLYDVASSGMPETSISTPDPMLVAQEWDKKGPVRDRVKKALDLYGNNPPVLSAISTVEAKAMVQMLNTELAKRKGSR